MATLLSMKIFVSRAIDIHGDKYDYSATNYTGSANSIDITCRKHGKFVQRAGHHLAGSGCPKCKCDAIIAAKRISLDEFKLRLTNQHGNKYQYDLSNYTGIKSQIDVFCNKHGWFNQIAEVHANGHGCPNCGQDQRTDNRKTTIEFRQQASALHDNIYDYSNVVYKGAFVQVEIICSVHGIFNQTPDNHLHRRGCPKCVGGISKRSQQWLDSLNIPDDTKHREVRGLVDKYIVDGYDPLTKTVYEFYGDYWHGNPNLYEGSDINPSVGKTYGELYQRTIIRREAFRAAGFTVVEMWENDWISTGCEKITKPTN